MKEAEIQWLDVKRCFCCRVNTAKQANRGRENVRLIRSALTDHLSLSQSFVTFNTFRFFTQSTECRTNCPKISSLRTYKKLHQEKHQLVRESKMVVTSVSRFGFGFTHPTSQSLSPTFFWIRIGAWLRLKLQIFSHFSLNLLLHSNMHPN